MALKNTSTTTSQCSISSLFLLFTLICILSLSLLLIFNATQQPSSSASSVSKNSPQFLSHHIKVYVADLPRSLNYGLLDKYWSLNGDLRLGSDEDQEIRSTLLSKKLQFPPYPENPLIKQYSAEYWIMGDLMTPEKLRTGSFARRVFDVNEADAVFVPFFATLSAEMQLGVAKGVFRKKVGNEDYERQREVVDFVKGTEAWKRSGGRNHVFVVTDPVAMWHFRAEISSAILLVVDFGGWYRLDTKASKSSTSDVIQHTQVSLLKDVIVPYTHLLPQLQLSENKKRQNLLYFKGAKHRHRGGLVREKLWNLLVNEPGVTMEEGFPNATGREQSIKGMRTSEFCLHPAGDTPTSCRLFDAIQSLCIPVIVSDNIELPFEGMVDYSGFSVFIAVSEALQPNKLVTLLRSFSKEQRDGFRRNMAEVQAIFEYDYGHLGGIGPIAPDGAVNHIWKKVHQKLPMINEAIVRERRKPLGASVPFRCHCV
ncbi:probable arabinosyltransferase ARAD1 isoform X1 [Malania oleifera]|uniref:probable arabinosyltransferase ARAD1 isoform X1 n=1 Tax=Malania oleifera TaxID=397392 RepID=UPI0025ADC741|nr:probable arabinosyltransferase ARAD1 isoform X1 [Malania oleifera]XP_057978803.1 probable arabinosyltransferase ARAD1 isoform X1 [Malania oleifera]